jgi:hypothetical protein
MCRARSTASAVRQLPSRSQMTRGGAPRSTLRWRKSSSFVTIVNPCADACPDCLVGGRLQAELPNVRRARIQVREPSRQREVLVETVTPGLTPARP